MGGEDVKKKNDKKLFSRALILFFDGLYIYFPFRVYSRDQPNLFSLLSGDSLQARGPLAGLGPARHVCVHGPGPVFGLQAPNNPKTMGITAKPVTNISLPFLTTSLNTSHAPLTHDNLIHPPTLGTYILKLTIESIKNSNRILKKSGC